MNKNIGRLNLRAIFHLAFYIPCHSESDKNIPYHILRLEIKLIATLSWCMCWHGFNIFELYKKSHYILYSPDYLNMSWVFLGHHEGTISWEYLPWDEMICDCDILRIEWNGWHFTDNIFKMPYPKLKFVLFFIKLHWGMFIRDQLTIIQHYFMWWLGWIGDKPLSKPMLTKFTDAYMWH